MRTSVRQIAFLLFAATSLPAANSWRLIGWSDFGINPMERDYSLFAIYPPYGTIHAQLIDPSGALYRGAAGVTVTYSAVADSSGSVNSSSSGKTNFFQFAKGLFGVSAPEPAITGRMTFEGSYNRFNTVGIPITPYDDKLNLNYYPLLQLTARDASGTVLATTNITLPVSNEVECRGCHASGVNADAQPIAGYANDSNPNRDFKLNILQLHDEKNRRNPAYQSALAGLNYPASGLVSAAVGGTAVSCTACHSSNQFNSPGIGGIESLTGAMHLNHASVVDPATNDVLDHGSDRATCYHCHPGTHTQALRGPMSRSVAADGSLQIHCQNCHGTMSTVGDPARNGWMDLPNCQACHIGTASTTIGRAMRLTSAINPTTGALNQTTDLTFATTPNQPAAGTSLFRFSTGHGNLQCSACHGTTHAELPSSQANDNVQSIALAGSSGGIIQECTTCHQSGISSNNGGPHGMHDAGAGWVNSHTRAARTPSLCQPCHGMDYRGTVLSQAFAARTLNIDRGTLQMFKGYQIGCYTCHNGPSGDGNAPAAAVVSNASATATSGQAVTIPISVTGGGVLRIVSQPLGGTAYVSGNSIVYQPRSGFEGADQVTYAALTAAGRDSNLGTSTLSVKAAVRPSFASSGVANAASYANGIAPGMIAYIYGAAMGPSGLASYELNSGGFIEKAAGGTRVLFNGIPSPVLYTSDSQLSAIVPYGVSGATASVVVEYNGIQSTAIAVPVSASLPGIFTANSSGKGQAAVLNADGSANSVSNPATRGSVVTLFLTGEGATDPPVVDGRLATPPYAQPAAPYSVMIGGQLAQVQYGGAAPAEVAGMMQVNAVVPDNIAPGTTSVVVSVGGTLSAAGVTIEVK